MADIDRTDFKRYTSTEAYELMRKLVDDYTAGTYIPDPETWGIIADVWEGEVEFWRKAIDLARGLNSAAQIEKSEGPCSTVVEH